MRPVVTDTAWSVGHCVCLCACLLVTTVRCVCAKMAEPVEMLCCSGCGLGWNRVLGGVRRGRGSLRGRLPVHYRHTHTRPFNGPFSGTTQLSRYQKGKTNLDFTGARDSKWQWHQLGCMQVCTLLQTDNHTSTPPLSFLHAG